MSNLMMPSRVLLYGRKMRGIKIKTAKFDAANGSGGGLGGLGNNRFLRDQFDPNKCGGQKPRFAMIYGFEFEAHYYDLMAPTIMLVHGKGINIHRGRGAEAVADAIADVVASTVEKAADAAVGASSDGKFNTDVVKAAAKAAADADITTTAVAAAADDNPTEKRPYLGRVERPFPEFEDDVRVWPYDKADFSMRLDPSSGPIESILLEAEIDDAEMADEMAGRKVSGRKVGGYLGRGRKVSGRKVGISGRKVRGD